jgi:hypothetical protein
MSQMRVPVTDAFDKTDPLESLEVQLTPKQIQWLEDTAADRGLSVDHMLRSIINAQIRGAEQAAPAERGDGTAHQSPPDVSGSSPTESPPEPDAEEDGASDPPSIVESLRSASERLQDLTKNDEDAQEPDLHDTLARLQAHVDSRSSPADASSSEDAPQTTMLDSENRSMFDMMEDE